jgi:hypothetical protein
MTPIYFKQKGAQIILRSDELTVVVCRRLRNHIGEMILQNPGRMLIRSDWHSTSEVLLKEKKYYFIYTAVTNPLPHSIDDFINEVVEEATDAMQWI